MQLCLMISLLSLRQLSSGKQNYNCCSKSKMRCIIIKSNVCERLFRLIKEIHNIKTISRDSNLLLLGLNKQATEWRHVRDGHPQTSWYFSLMWSAAGSPWVQHYYKLVVGRTCRVHQPKYFVESLSSSSRDQGVGPLPPPSNIEWCVH